ncbi:hypothetical protein [Ferrovibrio sp.]|uniref:hypothetical protein n=1 Tax=Ferrovibrio sp. TaxID=1917215 RepID=UPI0035124B89
MLLGIYDVLNQEIGSFEPAELHSPIGESNVRDYSDHWRPAFEERVRHLRTQGALASGMSEEGLQAVLGNNDLQDAHWQWAHKVKERASTLEWKSFAVEAGGMTQALMFVRLSGFALEPTQKNLPLAGIDLLATAPWNRRRLAATPKYKGLGRLLMAAAISLSADEEFKGRIGLHALPQAETFYRDVCGMTDLGIDQTKMRYFEMTESQAMAFLK